MNIHSIKLYLYPLEDIHCGYGLQQGNILPSLAYIPGRVIRGSLAGWAVRTGKVTNKDALFERLFLPQNGDSVVSFPNCTYKGLFPAPASLFEAKGRGKDPRTALVMPPPSLFVKEQIDKKISDPVDFLRRRIWPSEITSETLKPYTGQVDEYGKLHPTAPTILDLKSPHEENTGRVGKGATGSALFAEEALPSSMVNDPSRHYYSGELNFIEDKDVAALFNPLIEEFFDPEKSPGLECPEPARLLFIGHRRVPAVVYGKDIGCIDTGKEGIPITPDDRPFSITLTSDLIPENSTSPYPLTAEMIKSLLSLGSLCQERVFCRKGMTHGYDVQNKRKLEPMATISAGSCGLFSGTLTDDQIRQMWEQSLVGMGQKSQDGFGRFKINWEVHNIEEETS